MNSRTFHSTRRAGLSLLACAVLATACAPTLEDDLAQVPHTIDDDNASNHDRPNERATEPVSDPNGAVGTSASGISARIEADDLATRTDVQPDETANPATEAARASRVDAEEPTYVAPLPADNDEGASESVAIAEVRSSDVRCPGSRYNCRLPNPNGNRIINAMRGDEWWPVRGHPPLYDGVGNLRGHVARSAVKINFGQRRTLRGESHVYAFSTALLSGRAVSGWIPESSIVHQRTIRRMPTVRAPDPGLGDRGTYVMAGNVLSWGRLTYSPRPGHGLVEHYLTRAGDVVNLCYNLPGAGGVADDTFPIGTIFRRSAGVNALVLPLYHLGNNTVVRHMTFYYGHVGSRFGWVARAALRRVP